MTWFRVDDKSAFHSKVVAAGNAAWGAFCRLGAYCSDHETDGDVTIVIANLIATAEELDRLVSARLLERKSDGSGFVIHDFLDWNPSAEDVQALRKTRINAGRKGGSKRQANTQALARPLLGSGLKQTPSKPQAKGEGSGEGSLSGSGSGISSPSALSDPGTAHARESNGRARHVEAGAPAAVRAIASSPLIDSGSVLVDCWLDGMRQATGQPSWIRASIQVGVLQSLRAVLELSAPSTGREAWAEADAKAYVSAHPGAKLNVFGYQAWVQSNRAAPSAARLRPGPHAIQQPPAGGPRWKSGDGQ